MKFATSQEQITKQITENFPADETTKVITASPLDKAEAESRIKFYDKGLGWYCKTCVMGMRANGTEGRIECSCGTSAYFKEMSHRQRKCRLEKSKDVKVSPQVDGHFIARTKGKSTGYMVIWDARYKRWACSCQDFRHHAKYTFFKCKHCFAVERFIKAKEKPVEEPDKPCDAITSVELLPEDRVAHWGARLQCAVGHETLRAKLEKEIRDSLSWNRCVECGAGIDFGKHRCRKCTDGMLSSLLEKKGFHRTDGTGTTNASIRVPTFVLNQGVHRRFKTKTAV